MFTNLQQQTLGQIELQRAPHRERIPNASDSKHAEKHAQIMGTVGWGGGVGVWGVCMGIDRQQEKGMRNSCIYCSPPASVECPSSLSRVAPNHHHHLGYMDTYPS